MTLLYLLFITVVTFIFINIVPKIGTDIQEFITRAPEFAIRGQEFITKIEQAAAVNLGLQETAKEIFSPANFRSIGQFALNNITSGGLILLKFLIGLILSYIFIMERKKIESFLRKMRDGNFAFFYEEYAIIARKIGTGFGMIFRAQAIIALVNAMVTTIGLVIISFMHAGTNFPYIITLSLIVFIFGFIPVFGTIISGVPIIIIAYGFA